MRFLITGATGSGTSTLGRALAGCIDGLHFEADDYFWWPSTPPFTARRDPVKRLSLILKALAECDAAVVSGSVYGWGKKLEESFSTVVFLTVPAPVRIERLRERELKQFGRVDSEFLEWAAQYDEGRMSGRSLRKHREWLSSLSCPIVHIDGVVTVAHAVETILAAESNKAFDRAHLRRAGSS